MARNANRSRTGSCTHVLTRRLPAIDTAASKPQQASGRKHKPCTRASALAVTTLLARRKLYCQMGVRQRTIVLTCTPRLVCRIRVHPFTVGVCPAGRPGAGKPAWRPVRGRASRRGGRSGGGRAGVEAGPGAAATPVITVLGTICIRHDIIVPVAPGPGPEKAHRTAHGCIGWQRVTPGKGRACRLCVSIGGSKHAGA